MSAATSAMAVAWSGVSSYSKASSNSRCQGLSAGEGVAGAGLALGVELQELRGHVAHGLLDPLLDLVPAAAAQPVERGPRALGARVLLHAVEGVDGHLELVAALVDEDHELAREAAEVEGLEALEAADAVVLVDDEVADAQVAEVGEEAPGADAAGRAR